MACVISLAYYSSKKDYSIYRELAGGKGYADMVFVPRRNVNKPAIIVELKWNKNAKTALQQISEKKYPESIAEYTGEILLVGINYDKKTKKHECVIEEYQK